MLLVHGGVEAAARRFAEGRADWSQGLAVVLEKHGYLDLEVCDVAALDAATVGRHACVIVARLEEGQWSQALRDLVLGGDRPVLVEGPLPEAVREQAGVASAQPLPRAPLSVVAVDGDLRRRGLRYGMLPGSRIDAPRLRPVPRDEAVEWRALPDVPITDAQATAWAAEGWDAEAWNVGEGAQVLVECRVEGSDSPLPAIVQRGHLFATAFGLLAYLVQSHTSQPWPAGTHVGSPRSTGLETLLLALVDQMHALAGVPRVRVLPWPRGARWALTVRHDFDRPLTRAEVEEVLRRHAEVGTSATWYWRSRHLVEPRRGPGGWLRRLRGPAGVDALHAVAAAPGHEVAHHTEQLYNGAEREEQLIEEALGAAVAGTSAHGDPTCFRFQGAPNVLWAATRGLRYTELIQHAHFHPHRFPALEADGGVQTLDVVCLPHHESFDLSMFDGDTNAERILRVVDTFMKVGGLMQVMNHPDLNVDELFDTLAKLPRQGRWDCTADEAARWWLSTHTLERLSLRVDGATVEVGSRDGVAGLVVELLMPDGTATEHTVDVEAGGRAIVTSGS